MELICQKLLLSLSYFFTARRSYASAVLRVVILLVCLSVRLSVKRVLCDKTKQYTADILIPHKTPMHQQCLVGDAHFRLCLLYTSPSPRDRTRSRMPSSA